MPTPAQNKTLRQSKKQPTGSTLELKQETVAALAAAGIAGAFDPAESEGPHSVLALVEDHGGRARLWCIPDAHIDAADRSALDKVSGRCFAVHFTADLAPEQFAGALLVLVRTGVLPIPSITEGIFLEIAEEFAAEGVEVPEADWPAIGGDVWGGREATDGLGAIALTHFYCVHLAS